MTTKYEELLGQRGVAFERTVFPAEVFTSEGVANAIGLPLSQVAKAMAVKLPDKRFVVALLPGNRRLDVSAVASAFQVRKATLAQRAEVAAATGLEVGAVTPLVALLRPALKVVIDKALRHWWSCWVRR